MDTTATATARTLVPLDAHEVDLVQLSATCAKTLRAEARALEVRAWEQVVQAAARRLGVPAGQAVRIVVDSRSTRVLGLEVLDAEATAALVREMNAQGSSPEEPVDSLERRPP